LSNPTDSPNLEFARKLIEHCCWEDERVWELAIVPLSDEQFVQATPFGLGSIQRECLHIMYIESSCLRRIRGDSSVAGPIRRNLEDRAAMHRRWSAIHAAWVQFMSGLDAELFFSDCTFADGDRDVRLKIWQLIFDVIYQSSTHRSDILRMVAEAHEAPEFDLSLMQFLSGVFRQ
jgi:uncharacterized damage-inducible protein DinB